MGSLGRALLRPNTGTSSPCTHNEEGTAFVRSPGAFGKPTNDAPVARLGDLIFTGCRSKPTTREEKPRLKK